MKARKKLAAGAAASALIAAVLGAPSAFGASVLPCNGPASRRVDLGTPTFSEPTKITNPLFPVGTSGQKIQLGEEAGEELRFETVLLPDTKTIRWAGQDIATRVHSFTAYTADRIAEHAFDYFAQDDAGNVWYFGEDVDNYQDGVIADHEGTWLAGKDGPPGMIMPANPKVGDIYRPENIPEIDIFEEVTVKKVNRVVPGPRGPVRGAILIQECLADGVLEDKIFAPAYGEYDFSVPSADEVARLALFVPTDAVKGSVPASLKSVTSQAGTIFDQAPSRSFRELKDMAKKIDKTWDGYEKTGRVPPLLAEQMEKATDDLEAAVDEKQADDVRQAAIDIAHASLDVELRYRSSSDIDRERVGVWHKQLSHDMKTGDPGDVEGDRATIAIIRARIR